MWRFVEILRDVDTTLKELQRTRDGRDKLGTIHGNRFVIHGVIKSIPATDLDNPNADLDAVKLQIAALNKSVLDKTIAEAKTLYPNAYPSNLFKNVSTCRDLAMHVLAKNTKTEENPTEHPDEQCKS